MESNHETIYGERLAQAQLPERAFDGSSGRGSAHVSDDRSKPVAGADGDQPEEGPYGANTSPFTIYEEPPSSVPSGKVYCETHEPSAEHIDKDT